VLVLLRQPRVDTYAIDNAFNKGAITKVAFRVR
jgi:hypothetical protein